MVRRIGFGDGSDGDAPPVRRRGAAPAPDTSGAGGDGGEKTRDRERARPAAPAWGAKAREPKPSKPRKDPSIGKLLVLGFIWIVIGNWSLAAYGGISGALARFRDMAEGYGDPVATLFPLIMPLAVGIFVTQLILGRRRKN